MLFFEWYGDQRDLPVLTRSFPTRRSSDRLTVRLQGPLDEPNVAIDGQPFQRQPEPAEQPATPDGGEPPAGGEQRQPQPVKPEELLKDGLENLLKGLRG